MKRSISQAFQGAALALALLGLAFSGVAGVVTGPIEVPTYYGLSTDTKPTASITNGSKFYELDTYKQYVWATNSSGVAAWVEWVPSVSQRTLSWCEDSTLQSCWVSLGGNTANVTQGTSNQVKGTPGEVIGFYVNSTNAGTVRFWDQVNATCNANAKGGAITPAVGWHWYPARFATGICALTSGTAVDITLFYR